MTCRGLLVVTGLALTSARGAEAQGHLVDLRAIVSTLNLTERGAAKWLERLQLIRAEGPLERLMFVSLTGEPLTEIDGERSSVVIGADLDRRLMQADRSIILLHNHPSNVGLSPADIGQLVRPGVAAIVAIAHDRSVFVATPTARFHTRFPIDTHYERARSETVRRLRTTLGRRAAEGDAQLSHLVCRVLDKAGVIGYWAELRGPTRESYETARMAFGQVVEGTAAWVKMQDRN